MAGNVFDVTAATVALTGTTAKTVLGIVQPTNIPVKVTEVAVSFDGATSTNAPAVCDFCQCTFATNVPGTNSTSITPQKRSQAQASGQAETLQSTAGKNWTSEPTVITVQWTIDVGQFNGLYHYIHPFSSPFMISSNGHNYGASLRVNSPNNVNCTSKMTAEE